MVVSRHHSLEEEEEESGPEDIVHQQEHPRIFQDENGDPITFYISPKIKGFKRNNLITDIEVSLPSP